MLQMKIKVDYVFDGEELEVIHADRGIEISRERVGADQEIDFSLEDNRSCLLHAVSSSPVVVKQGNLVHGDIAAPAEKPPRGRLEVKDIFDQSTGKITGMVTSAYLLELEEFNAAADGAIRELQALVADTALTDAEKVACLVGMIETVFAPDPPALEAGDYIAEHPDSQGGAV